MAKDYEITTKFTVDISDLKRGISEAEQQIKLANATFRNATAGAEDWENSIDGVSAKLDQLKSILEAQEKKVSAYTQEIQRNENAAKENAKRADELRAQLQELADKGVSKTSEEYRTLEKRLDTVTAEQNKNETAADKLKVTLLNQQAAVKSTQAEIKTYDSRLAELKGETQSAQTETKELAENIDEAGTKARDSEGAFTVMKGAIANLVADGIRMAISALKDFAKETVEAGKAFDSSMSKVGAISGATEEDTELLRQKAKDLGATTAFTASQVADGFSYMAMAGWKTEDMLSGIDGILSLAAASGSDLATTSDIVTDALTAFGLEAKDAGRLADVMAAASANANTNVEMMGSTFQYVAPVAGALGFSIEDTAEVIGLMANAGIKGTKAGTALRAMFSRLAAPTDEAGTAMDMLGVALTDSEGNVRDLADVMGDLRKGFAGLSEAEQAQYAKMIAGQEAMSGLLSIVNATDADIAKLSSAIDYSEGSANEMAAVMLDNLGGAMTILSSNFEAFELQLYERFEPIMQDAVGVVGLFVDALRGAADLDDVMSALSGLYDSIKNQIVPIAENATVFVLDIAEKLIESIPMLVDAGMRLAVGIISGIGKKLPDLIQTVVAMIPELIKTILRYVPDMIYAGIQLLMGIVQAIPTVIEQITTSLPEIIDTVVKLLVDGIPMLIDGAVSLLMALIDAIPIVIPIIVQNLPRIISSIVNGLLSSFDALLDGAVELLLALVKAIPIIIRYLVPAIPQIIDTLISTLLDNFPVLLNGAIELFMALVEAIPIIAVELFKSGAEIVEALFGGIKDLPEKLKTFFTGAWEKIKAVFAKVPDWFKEKFNDVVSRLKSVGEDFVEIFSGVWEKIKNTFKYVGSWFKNTFSGVLDVLKAPINVLIRGINKIIDGLNSISIDVPDWVPLIGGQHLGFNVPKLNELAQGGVLKRGQFGFLEGSGAEAVVPLEKNKAWIRNVAKDMIVEMGLANASAGTASVNNSRDYQFTQIINAPKAPSRIELYRQTRNLLALASEA